MISELEIQLMELHRLSNSINAENSTRKTTGGHYPIELGYATAVRRPIGDLLLWMHGVEDLLETLIKEVEK